jgi:hypothetical protein
MFQCLHPIGFHSTFLNNSSLIIINIQYSTYCNVFQCLPYNTQWYDVIFQRIANSIAFNTCCQDAQKLELQNKRGYVTISDLTILPHLPYSQDLAYVWLFKECTVWAAINNDNSVRTATKNCCVTYHTASIMRECMFFYSLLDHAQWRRWWLWVKQKSVNMFKFVCANCIYTHTHTNKRPPCTHARARAHTHELMQNNIQ